MCLLELLQPLIPWFEVVVTKSESQIPGLHQHIGSIKQNVLCTCIHEQLVQCSFHIAVSGTPHSFKVSAANVIVKNSIGLVLLAFFMITESVDCALAHFCAMSVFPTFRRASSKMVLFRFNDSTFLFPVDLLGVAGLNIVEKLVRAQSGSVPRRGKSRM